VYCVSLVGVEPISAPRALGESRKCADIFGRLVIPRFRTLCESRNRGNLISYQRTSIVRYESRVIPRFVSHASRVRETKHLSSSLRT
jgi:hypothetical protein